MAGGLIGALRVTLGIDTAAFEAGSARARKTAVSDANAIAKAYGGLKTAVSGLMAGISVGTLVAVTSKALDYASSLGEVAQQLGVTTKDLQEYRYAATQVGISQETMDKGLAKLTLSMGQARAGVEKPKAAFLELSKILGTDILKGAATAGDAIPLIADALKKVEDPAQRAALEVALFGKSGQQLDTLLSGGSGAVNELRDAAQKFGLVLSDEQIQNADKTADKISEVKQVLEASIAAAVSDNAAAIYNLAESLETLIAKIPAAINEMGKFFDYVQVGWGRLQALQGLATGNAMGMLNGLDNQAAGNKSLAIRQNYGKPFFGDTINAGVRKWAAEQRGGGGAGAGTSASSAASAAAKAKAAREKAARAAEKAAKDAQRRDERYAQEMGRLTDEQLRMEADLTNDTATRSEYAKRRIDNDQEAFKAELDAKVKAGELTAVQAKRLSMAQSYNANLEREIEDQRAEDDTTRAGLETRNESLSLQSDLVRGELSEAKTQAERRVLQQQLLDIEYDRQRAALEAVLALNSSTDAEKEIARARLAQLGALKASDAEGVRRDTAGPMERFGQELHRTSGQIKEDFEQIQVDGIEALNDGLVDAIMNSKSLGDVFKQVSNQIVADLIRIALREAESSIFGGKEGGGIGGLIGGISKLFGAASGKGEGLQVSGKGNSAGRLVGMATGGLIKIGGNPGIDTNLLSINGMPVARVNTGETLRVDPRQNGRDVPRFEIIPSPWFDVRAAGAAEPSIQNMGTKAASGGSSMAQQALARRQRQRLGR